MTETTNSIRKQHLHTAMSAAARQGNKEIVLILARMGAGEWGSYVPAIESARHENHNELTILLQKLEDERRYRYNIGKKLTENEYSSISYDSN